MSHHKDQLLLFGHMLFFSQLAASHMAHDLASPLGAMMTGLEMLDLKDASEDQQEILNLLQQSSNALRSRLDIFRAAYASGGQTVGVRYARTMAQRYFELHERVKLHWGNAYDQVKFSKGTLQLFLNILMWLHNKAPKGGDLTVTLDSENYILDAHIKSRMLFIQGEDEKILAGEMPLEHLQPQMAQTYMIFLLSTVFNYALTFESYSIDEIHIRMHSKSPKDFM